MDPPPPTPLLRRLQTQPSSTQLAGILTLIISGSILLLLTGLTVTGLVLSLLFLTPILVLTSPLWLPLAAFLLVAVACLVSVLGSAGAVAWGYRYLRGEHPVGSERVDYARSRLADTAGHMRDYAKEYGGGYWHGKVKDAAPGA